MDLARIAGMSAAGVICEIMNEDGTMSRVPQLIEFCKEHNLKMLTVADLIRYRMQHERYVRRVAEAVLPTRFGDFRMIAYASDVDHDQHIALVRGDLEGAEPALVRVHSHCLTGDVFGSTACDCQRTRARAPWKPLPRKVAAYFSIFITRDAASPSKPPKRPARSRRFIFTSAASSIANRPASAWSSTKAASARKF